MTPLTIYYLCAGAIFILACFLTPLIHDSLRGNRLRTAPCRIYVIPGDHTRPGAIATNYLTHIAIASNLFTQPGSAAILCEERAEQQHKRAHPFSRIFARSDIELFGRAVHCVIASRDPRLNSDYVEHARGTAQILYGSRDHYPHLASMSFVEIFTALVMLRYRAEAWTDENASFVEWACQFEGWRR
jgi:hypothetical protein